MSQKLTRALLIFYAGCIFLHSTLALQSDIHQRTPLTQLRRWFDSKADVEGCGRLYCGKPPQRQSKMFDQYLRCVAMMCALATPDNSAHGLDGNFPIITDPDILLCPSSTLSPGQVLKYCDSRACWVHSRQDDLVDIGKVSTDSSYMISEPRKDDLTGACITSKCGYGRSLRGCDHAYTCCFSQSLGVTSSAITQSIIGEEESVDAVSDLIGSAVGGRGMMTRKRRVNDDVSQCIQSYCSTANYFTDRLRCIVNNCHRSSGSA